MTETKKLIEATCPECRGPLSEVRQDQAIPEYTCLLGHRYSTLTLLDAHSDTQENALWAAVVALEEAATLAETVAPQFPAGVARNLHSAAEQKRRQALEIRDVLKRLERFQTG